MREIKLKEIYSQPLLVENLCRKCHGQVHRGG